MKKIFPLVLLLLFLKLTVSNTLAKNNFVFSWTPPKTNSKTFDFKILTRTINGYYSISLKKLNGTKEDGLEIVAYQQFNVAFHKFFRGSNLQTNLNFSLTVANEFPREYQLYNAVEHQFKFDLNSFQNSFIKENEFSIEFRGNYFSKPFLSSNGTLIYDKKVEEYSIMKINWINSSEIYQTIEVAFQFEQISPIYFGISLFIQVMLFFLSLLLIRYRPLKAYGFVPAFGMFLAILRFSSYGVYFGSLEFLGKNLCYFDTFFVYPTIICVILTVPLNLLRFVILLIIKERKSNVLQNRQNKNPTIKFQFKILKFISFPTTIPIILLIFFFFSSCIYLLALIPFEFKCPEIVATNIIFIIHFLTIAISCGLIGIIMLFDIFIVTSILIPRMKEKKIKGFDILLFILKYLWKQDVFYFRIQIYVILLMFIFPTFVITELLAGVFYEDFLPISIFLYLISNSILEYTFFIAICGLLIVATIFTIIKSLYIKIFKKVPKKTEIERFFEIEEFYQLLKEFSETGMNKLFHFYFLEFSLENVACYKDILEFQKLKSLEEKKFHLERMKELYFGSTAELEINISGSTLKKFMIDSTYDNLINDELFDEIRRTLAVNLSDTCARFILTYEYSNYAKKYEVMKELNVIE